MELTRYVTIGQYIPRESPVHRLDPRTKIAAVTLLMVAIFVVPDFFGYALLALFVLGIVLSSQIPLGYLLRALRPILFLLALTVVLNMFFSGIQGGTPLFSIGPVAVTREAFLRALFIGTRKSRSPTDTSTGVCRLAAFWSGLCARQRSPFTHGRPPIATSRPYM